MHVAASSRMTNINLLLVLSLTAFGCVDQTTDHEPSKSDSAKSGGKGDNGEDDCAKFGWYGDGVCDLFCPMPDIDCMDGPGGSTKKTCAEANVQCMTSFQFPTSAPSCENEYHLVTVTGTCPQFNQSCCAAAN
jgi:hypothetical protein